MHVRKYVHCQRRSWSEMYEQSLIGTHPDGPSHDPRLCLVAEHLRLQTREITDH